MAQACSYLAASLSRFWSHVGLLGCLRFLMLFWLLLPSGCSLEPQSILNVASVPTEPVHPLAWVLGGASGATLLSMLIRTALKNWSAVALDRKTTTSEITIHDSYGRLIKNLEEQIDRLNTEVDRMRTVITDCERRHDARERELDELKDVMRKHGLV
jgi:hypothetical protein